MRLETAQQIPQAIKHVTTEKQKEQDILAFCHIIKTAGTSYTDLLKYNFGPYHLNVEPARGSELYTSREMDRDLGYMPWLKSLAGHGLRPYVDYGQFNERLRWITWFRDPVARLISGYQHGVEKNQLQIPFGDWLQEPGHKNLHVYFLTGDTDDLQGAKEILESKNFFVGLVEQFDHSLANLQNSFPHHNLDLSYQKRSNTAITARTAKDIYDNIDQYKDLILENTELDNELYQWVKRRHDEAVMGIERPKTSGQISKRLSNKPSIQKQLNALSTSVIRHLIYKPVLSKF